MTRDCFALLCEGLSLMSVKKIKSEYYIDVFLKSKAPMYDAHVKGKGRYISGEVKLAIILHIIIGGDAYDLATILMCIPPIALR